MSHKRVYKAIIFDIDGTLVHTTPKYRHSVFRETLNILGKPISEDNLNEIADKFWYYGNRDDLIKNYLGINPESFWDVFRIVDKPELRSKNTIPYDDTRFIHKIKRRGYKIGAVTGAPYIISRLNIDKLGNENFDSVVNATNTNGVIAKPNPHGIELCLDYMKITSKEAIFVGNGDEDVIAAQSAGVLDVLIDRGEYKFPHIKPSVTISSLYELEKIIKC